MRAAGSAQFAPPSHRTGRDGSRFTGRSMRHTAATFHYPLSRDEQATCALLGHTSPVTLRTHYKGLTTESEAKKFYALRPTAFCVVGHRAPGDYLGTSWIRLKRGLEHPHVFCLQIYPNSSREHDGAGYFTSLGVKGTVRDPGASWRRKKFDRP